MGLQTPLNNTVYGTILAGGTLSSQFDLQGYNALGLIVLDNSVNGTLNFRVSDLPDVNAIPGQPGGVYRTLYGSNGAAVALTINSGQGAISSDALTPLKGYRYVRVQSTAQTNGLALMLTLKSD